jgi:DNA-directed RNA polymerase specialized sigma24 family protein
LRMKGDGLSLATIAERTGLHVDSVRRVLRRLARQLSLEPRACATDADEVADELAAVSGGDE